MRHVRMWALTGLVCQLGLVGGYFIAVQAQDVASLERRIADVDKDLSGRVRVLESDMAEVKWLARGVAMAVTGQLIITAFALKERSK